MERASHEVKGGGERDGDAWRQNAGGNPIGVPAAASKAWRVRARGGENQKHAELGRASLA